MLVGAVNLPNLCKLELQCVRSFHTSLITCAREAKFMKKIMGANNKKKRPFVDTPILPSPNTFSQGTNEGKHSVSSKRSTVLNKLFMKYITDLMAHGESCKEFLGHGIEINRVKIAPDFRGLNVFWVAKGTADDDIVEQLLKKNAGYLRHELSGLRVMGVVPKIYFVKDKQYAKVLQVDTLLSQADYGEDYEPANVETRLKTQLELYTPLSAEDKEALQNLDSEQVEDQDHEEEPMPLMPQNACGLNHGDIMNRIKRLLKKSKAKHRFEEDESTVFQLETNENPVRYKSSAEQREAFKRFLHERELLRSKARKEEKYMLPDLEYKPEEVEYFEDVDVIPDEFDDFIVEEENK